MAFRKNENTQETTSTRGAAKNKPAVLGYINIGLNTNKPGDVRRVDSIRLMEGNALHEVIFQGLNAEREGDPEFVVPEGASDKVIADLEAKRKALLAERLAGFISKLNVSFNPSRTDADSDLIQF
jgi:hypothetical protein